MSIYRHGFLVCSTALLAAAWSLAPAMNQSPASPPDSTAAGAPSDLGHSVQPSGVAAGTGINHDTVVEANTSFIQSTSEDNAAELAAAQYALANSQSPDVTAFARGILATRSKSDDQLRDLATRLGVTMPTYPTTRQSHVLETLRTQRGAQFDAAYARFMADEHTQAVERFKRAAASSTLDPTVRDYAETALPMMHDTLQQANKLVASHARRSRTG